MTKKKPSQTQFVVKGSLAPEQQDQLQAVIELQRKLYNDALHELEAAHQAGQRRTGDDLAEILLPAGPEYAEPARTRRKIDIATLKRAVAAWDAHAYPNPGTQTLGQPHTKQIKEFRTIQIAWTEDPERKLQRDAEDRFSRPILDLPGLPPIKLKSPRQLPDPHLRQPCAATITLRKNRITVSLNYPEPAESAR